jgi:hypothetical protein
VVASHPTLSSRSHHDIVLLHPILLLMLRNGTTGGAIWVLAKREILHRSVCRIGAGRLAFFSMTAMSGEAILVPYTDILRQECPR